jgi:ketosteroid isomerase-like protein
MRTRLIEPDTSPEPRREVDRILDRPPHARTESNMVSVTTDLFADIDRMDAHAFASHLSEDCRLRFGNADPVAGRSAIEAAISGFFTTIKGLSHDIVSQWDAGDSTMIEAEVTYTRLDERQVTVPVVTIYRRGDALIDDYRIFIDLAPVLA